MCNRDKPWVVAPYGFRQIMIHLESGSCSYVDSRDMNRSLTYLATSMLLWLFLVAHVMLITAKSLDSYSKPCIARSAVHSRFRMTDEQFLLPIDPHNHSHGRSFPSSVLRNERMRWIGQSPENPTMQFLLFVAHARTGFLVL
jgi:hypothetical protein